MLYIQQTAFNFYKMGVNYPKDSHNLTRYSLLFMPKGCTI